MRRKRMKNLIILLSIIVLATPLFAETGSSPFDYSPIQHGKENITEEMRISRGGQLYDNWWKTTTEGKKPQDDHPLWKLQDTNKRKGYSTYRCKECHGWDYRGKEGAYSKGSHFTGFEGVYMASQKMSVEELEGVLKGSTNKDHDFSGYLSGEDISDLALFLKKGVIDLTMLINTEGLPARGDVAAGRSFFAMNCMTECHGNNGMAINFKSEEKPEFLGTVANKNPWEFIHKIRAGQPGTRMSSGIINKWSSDDLMNALAYARTLPKEKTQEGWLERMKILVGMAKEKKSIVVEETRGFGPKLVQ
jgi:thiosulfate dehydrogenase